MRTGPVPFLCVACLVTAAAAGSWTTADGAGKGKKAGKAKAATTAAAATAAGAATAVPVQAGCGANGSPGFSIGLAKGEEAIHASIAGAAGGDGLIAAAIEALGDDEDSTSVIVRVGRAGQGTGGKEWILSASAILGNGSAPSIARTGGKSPAWVVLMARREGGGGVRPVAVGVSADQAGERLDLVTSAMDAAGHVFGPTAIRTGEGEAALIWGESDGAEDRLRMMRWPAKKGEAPATIAKGSMADRFAATALDGGGVLVAWLEVDPSAVEGWKVMAGSFGPGGEARAGPVLAAAVGTPALITAVSAVAGAGGVAVHLVQGSEAFWKPMTVTGTAGLGGWSEKTWKEPRIAAGSTVAGTSAGAGGSQVVAWRAERGGRKGMWAWSGGPAWMIAPAGGRGPMAVVADGDGIIAGWATAPDDAGSIPTVEVRRMGLGDYEGDGVPDAADSCPEVAGEIAKDDRDGDGCPEPPGATASPLEAKRFWFEAGGGVEPCGQPSSAAGMEGGRAFVGGWGEGRSFVAAPEGAVEIVYGLPGRVVAAVAAPGGGAVAAAGGGLWLVAAGGEATRIEIGKPDGAADAPAVRGVAAMGEGRIAALTASGAAVVDSGSWKVGKWIEPGMDVAAAAWHGEAGMLLAGADGALVRTNADGGDPKAVAAPAGTKGDRVVSMLVSKGRIAVAWADAGAFLKDGGWKAKWSQPALPGGGWARGARRLASGPGEETFLVTGGGALLALGESGWAREEAGLEGRWIADAFTDPASGGVRLVAAGPVVSILAAHGADERIILDAGQFTASGKGLKPGAAKVMDPVLEQVKARKRLARIEGHTGTKGEAATNLYVSLAIAQVVESWLVERGAPASAIEVVGLGGSFPPANQGADPRRIEIVLLVP